MANEIEVTLNRHFVDRIMRERNELLEVCQYANRELGEDGKHEKYTDATLAIIEKSRFALALAVEELDQTVEGE